MRLLSFLEKEQRLVSTVPPTLVQAARAISEAGYQFCLMLDLLAMDGQPAVNCDDSESGGMT